MADHFYLPDIKVQDLSHTVVVASMHLIASKDLWLEIGFYPPLVC